MNFMVWLFTCGEKSQTKSMLENEDALTPTSIFWQVLKHLWFGSSHAEDLILLSLALNFHFIIFFYN
jgi:hypothetical protein